MKTSELLEKLLHSLDMNNLDTGLCLLAYFELNIYDYERVIKYFRRNKPLTWRTIFRKLEYAYWWEEGKVEPRKKWLKKHIKKLKAKGL